MTIYLLGVYHCFQTEDHAEFIDYLWDFLRSHGISSIGEEMNLTALSDEKKNRSTIGVLADKLSVPHAYCDPDVDERKRLGILGENRLKCLKLCHGWTDEEFEYRKTLDNQKRETVWLERLKNVFINPMLFVCGIDHLNSFGALLGANGFGVRIAERSWTLRECPQNTESPNNGMQPTSYLGG